MHFPYILCTSMALPLLALAAPVSATVQDSKPWTLYDITLWTAKPSTPGASYIDFLFEDDNKGIKLNTECYRAAIPGNRHAGIDDPENWYPCASPQVSFKYNKGRIDIQRTYRDPSVGKPDKVTASGHKMVSFTTKNVSCGALGSEDELKVPITSLNA